MPEHALIATLGAQPQVVTLTLDLLRAAGYTVSRVVAIHTQEEEVLASRGLLEAQLAAMGERFEFRLVRDEGQPVARVLRESEVAALASALSRAILDVKALGLGVHLSVSGGSKIMAAEAVVAAQWLFGEGDRVWHMHSPGWRRGGRRRWRVTPTSHDVLIPVPLLRWGNIAPMLPQAGPSGGGLTSAQAGDLQRKAEFVQRNLTAKEREVLELAAQGLDAAAIGRLLTKSPRTVTHQLENIYDKCNAWEGLPEHARPMRHVTLVAVFGPLYRP